MFRSQTSSRSHTFIVSSLLLSLIALFSVACGGDTNGNEPTANPTVVQVNGFGTAANHVHSLAVLPPHVLVLATHYGLFRSQDGGTNWQVVAPGNDTPDEVYVYLSELGPLGLKRSLDNGQHFTSTGTLPFGMIFGVLAVQGAPGHLLAYSSDGMAYSTDGGIHWQVIKNISGSINDVTTAGSHSPIYTSGNEGIYSSSDGGKTFQLVYTQASFASLTASPTQPQVIYGKTGTSVYRSDDGGHSWNTLPHISGNLAVLSADPMNALSVYLSLSYPTALYRFSQDNKDWLSLTPQT